MYKIIAGGLLCLFCLSAAAVHPGKATVWAEEMLKEMTLDEKIGQLFMIAVYSNKDKDYEDKIEKTIRTYRVGGLIFFQGEPVRQAELTNRYQKASKYPLLIGIDAEHGLGWRLKTCMEFPKMLIAGAGSDDSLTFRLGAAIARHCKEMGIHVNFAPVADINNNPLNPVIGNRSFGEDRENVLRKTEMYVQGTLSQNILPVIKHFPGHGDTDTDSHLALPLIRHDRRRLDSIELYPFRQLIRKGIPALMVAHLNVPALDSSNRPASLSPAAINGYIRDSLHFDGLCFTDAMNMRGVTRGKENGTAETEALLAGNDILLFPANLGLAIAKIKKAIADSILTEEIITEKCRKILLAKYTYVLPGFRPVKTGKLWSRLNTPEDFALKHDLYKNAVTLVKNSGGLLPLRQPDTLRIASINFGAQNINHFQTMLSNYAAVRHFTLTDKPNDEALENLVKQLKAYDCVIVYNSKASDRASRHFGYSSHLTDLLRRLAGKKVVLCHPAIPYGLANYTGLPLDAILVSYEDHIYARQYAAQAVFGGIPAEGKLPVSISPAYPAGTGISTAKTRLGYALPEMCHLSSSRLSAIDSVCKAAIRLQATPGCQVLVAKDGYIVYDKAFGHHTYEKKKNNHTNDIYDIASVTKITATLPAVMKLYDEGKIDLDCPLSDYYPALKSTDKKDITGREILMHTAGLKPFVPAFADAIDKTTLHGPLFTKVPTKQNTLKLKDRLYANPAYRFRDSTFSRTPRPGYTGFTPGLYIFDSYRDTAFHSILVSGLLPAKEYVYSDLGFILLQKAVENISGQSLDRYCKETFYRKLGATHTDYNAAERLGLHSVVPSCVDKLYRKKEIKGYVHDPTAAIFGGIAGHAGLFSTAADLAKIMQMYLDKGNYGGEHFFSPATVDLFTRRADPHSSNRRGLGFDKPETDTTKNGPACRMAPPSSFGHTGFTGTIAWADPDHRLIYIFLSNRTYPNEFNTKLTEENIRTKIQEIIYRALLPVPEENGR